MRINLPYRRPQSEEIINAIHKGSTNEWNLNGKWKSYGNSFDEFDDAH